MGIGTFFVVVICFMAVAADVKTDFKYLTSIFPGLFDNIIQYEADIHHALPPAYRHKHLTTSVVPENIPVLKGRTSFYLEQYLNETKNNLIRQRIYSFAIDSMKRINLKIFSLVNQAKFAHALPNSPMFKSLKMKDVVYAKGCDVYWNRVSDDLFRTNMFNTCIVPIGGAQVLIIDKSTLSSRYLTADETWIFTKNGSVLQVYPGPYNMTRQSTTPIPRLSLSEEKDSASRLGIWEFNNLLSILTSGQPVRYYLTSDCLMSGTGTGSQPEFGGYIDAYEFFNDTAFGPVPYFGFSTFLPQRMNSSDKLVIHLREGSVYNDGSVKMKLTVLSPDYKTALGIQTFSCHMSTDGTSGSAFFYPGKASITRLPNYTAFVTALHSGAHVRFSANYGLCDLGVNAIGGGRIEDFDISMDGQIVTSSQFKIITNYQGPGYVNDIVIGTIYSNNTVVFIASDVAVDTDRAFYVEKIDCAIDTGSSTAGVSLYQVN